jgi:hypothetical protein
MRVERLGLGQLLLLMLLLLLFLPSVLGLGLSYEYLEEKTLTLAPGEQHFFKLTFQNDEPESVRVSVLLESEIAELVGDAEITIPAETYDTFVYFDIQVPEEATPGSTYRVNYEVLPLEDGEGQVPFTIKYSRWFDVAVAEGEAAVIQEPSDLDNVARDTSLFGSVWITIILIGALLVVVVLAWRRSELLGFKLLGKKEEKKVEKKVEKVPEQRVPTPATIQKPSTTAESSKREEESEEKSIESPENNDDAALVVEKRDEAAPVAEKKEGEAVVAEEKPVVEELPHFDFDPATLPSVGAAPGHEFFFEQRKARTMQELYACLKELPEEEFGRYVSSHKNDISLWIEGSLKLPHYAEKLANTRTKEEMLHALETL